MIYKTAGIIALMLSLSVYVAWNLPTTISVERTFDDPEAKIWKVWSDADSIQKWWGPKGYSARVVRNDVRPGGSYLWAMNSDRGMSLWNTGIYKEVVINKKLVSTMSFSNEQGVATPGSQVSLPGKWPDEITVTVELTERKGKSKVTVTEAGIPLITYPMSRIGWAQQFDKIQTIVGTSTKPPRLGPKTSAIRLRMYPRHTHSHGAWCPAGEHSLPHPRRPIATSTLRTRDWSSGRRCIGHANRGDALWNPAIRPGSLRRRQCNLDHRGDARLCYPAWRAFRLDPVRALRTE